MKLAASPLILLACLAVYPQQDSTSAVRKVTPPIPVDQIIKKFAAKESDFSLARNQYLYRQEVRIREVGLGNSVIGEFYRVSEVVFDDTGKRLEKILRFPPSSLQGIVVSAEDLAGFGTVQPFALTQEELPNYQVTYIGKEKIDEIDTYVFDVVPKFMIPLNEKIRRGKKISEKEGGIEGRAFEGRIWVDDLDLQIVKTHGKAVPEVKQRFPRFESYRENIDKIYWFPTYVWGDDTLEFENGHSVRLRFEIKYTDYKKFSGVIEVLEDGEIEPKKPVPPAEKKP